MEREQKTRRSPTQTSRQQCDGGTFATQASLLGVLMILQFFPNQIIKEMPPDQGVIWKSLQGGEFFNHENNLTPEC